MTIESLLKSIDPALLKLGSFTPPSFPLEKAEEALSQLFEKETRVEVKEKSWVPFQGGAGVLVALSLPPVQTPFYLHVAESQFSELIALFFHEDKNLFAFFEKGRMEEFILFLVQKLGSVLEGVQAITPLEAKIVRDKKIDSLLYQVEVGLQVGKKRVQGELLFPKGFQEEWAQSPLFALERKKKMDHLECELAVEIGYSEVQEEELLSMKEGDYLLLDRSFLDLAEKTGSLLLTLSGEPLFRGKLKEQAIKILDYPRLEGAMEEKEGFVEGEKQVELNKIPLRVTVELTRLRMTIEELSSLKEGSVIDLNIPLDQGVDLVVSGKRIGKGEMVKVGETMAVRLTQLYTT